MTRATQAESLLREAMQKIPVGDDTPECDLVSRIAAFLEGEQETLMDHEFRPSKRDDSCDFTYWQANGPWLVCDRPQAAHGNDPCQCRPCCEARACGVEMGAWEAI